MTRARFVCDTSIKPDELVHVDGQPFQDSYVPIKEQLGRHMPTSDELRELRAKKKPLPTGWQTVTYLPAPSRLSEADLRQMARRKHEKRVFDEEIMADPLSRWLQERQDTIISTVRRMQRDQRYAGWSFHKLWRYVDGYLSRASEPVILTKPKSKPQSAQTEHGTASRRRASAGSRRQAAIERKAEAGDFTQKFFTKEFIDQITQARLRRRIDQEGVMRPMTQQELAKMVNVTPKVIQDFEAGKLAFDARLQALLIWKLGLAMDTD